jgi:hypothetical protein
MASWLMLRPPCRLTSSPCDQLSETQTADEPDDPDDHDTEATPPVGLLTGPPTAEEEALLRQQQGLQAQQQQREQRLNEVREQVVANDLRREEESQRRQEDQRRQEERRRAALENGEDEEGGGVPAAPSPVRGLAEIAATLLQLAGDLAQLDEAGRQELARQLAALEDRDALRGRAEQLWEMGDTADGLAEHLAQEWARRRGTSGQK